MILTEAKIYNFRSLKEVDVKLKPLTIFVGPNASGKSSILYAIAWMVLKSLKNPFPESVIGPDEKEVLHVNSYEDLALARDLSKRWTGVTLTFDISDEMKGELERWAEKVDWNSLGLKKPSLERLAYGFKIHRNIVQVIDYELFISIDGLSLKVKAWYDELENISRWSLEGSMHATGDGRLSYPLLGGFYIRARIQDFKGELKTTEYEALLNLDNFIESTLKRLKEVFERFFLITSNRGMVPLSCEAGITDKIGPKGEDLLRGLAYAYAHHDRRVKEELSGIISKWSGRFGIKQLNAGLDEDRRIRATYVDLGTDLDLALGSYGQRQLLTFLTQLIVAPKRSVIMIEEPEMSLHPEAQMLIPLLFADLIKNHDKQILVTTHSSIIPLALSDAITGSDKYPDVPKLNSDDVAVYHVDRGKDGVTEIEPIKLTKEGYPEGGIPSFVAVEAELYKKLLSRLS